MVFSVKQNQQVHADFSKLKKQTLFNYFLQENQLKKNGD
jgi:hypothetical protein